MKAYTFLLAIIAFSAQAKTFRATTSGNWSTPQTWSCNCVPGNGDHVTIPEGIMIVITKPVTLLSIQLTIFGELDFNNGILQIDESDKVTVMPGGRIVAKGAGGTLYVGAKPHYFEHGKAITGPATVGKTVSPIALMFFAANSNEGQVVLTWASAGEANIKRYEILSSTDSVTFQPVGSVKGSNSSFKRKDYNFPIGTSVSAAEFFRLEAIRNDSARVVLSTAVVK
jgi:hypothetical protein